MEEVQTEDGETRLTLEIVAQRIHQWDVERVLRQDWILTESLKCII